MEISRIGQMHGTTEEEKKEKASHPKLRKETVRHFLGYQLKYRAQIEKTAIPLFEIPRECGSFQLNNKLYVGGGYYPKDYKATSHFFSLKRNHHKRSLAPLCVPRWRVSLSGTCSLLIAVGGHDKLSLPVSELYSIKLNRWRLLPFL